MADVEDLKIILRAEVDKAISDLKRASREGKNAERDWNGISKSFQENIKHSLSLKNAFSQLTMQVAGGLAIYSLAKNALSAVNQTVRNPSLHMIKPVKEHARSRLRSGQQVAPRGIRPMSSRPGDRAQTATKISENEVRSAQSALLKLQALRERIQEGDRTFPRSCKGDGDGYCDRSTDARQSLRRAG